MTRRPPLLTLLACLLTLAGCGGSHNASKSTTSGVTRHAITTSTGRGKIAAAAQKFAVAYVRFLDGAGTASGLPATSCAASADTRCGGEVPRVGVTPTGRSTAAGQCISPQRSAACPRRRSSPRSELLQIISGITLRCMAKRSSRAPRHARKLGPM